MGEKVHLSLGTDFAEVSDTNPLPVKTVSADGAAGSPLPVGTSRSGAITTGGTAQVLAAANTARRGLEGQNISGADLWVNEVGGTAAADTAGSNVVGAGATFSIRTQNAISIVGATTGQKFTAVEF